MPAEGGFHVQATRAFDVVVVGGGVIGLAVAWRAGQRGLRRRRARTRRAGRRHLARRRRHARADRRGAAGRAAAAGAWGWRARAPTRRSWPSWSRRRSGRSRLHAVRNAAGGARRRRGRGARCASSRCAAARSSAVQRLRASEARRREPALAPALRLALDVPDDHAIDPRKLTARRWPQRSARAAGRCASARRWPAVVADGRVRGVDARRRRAGRAPSRW